MHSPLRKLPLVALLMAVVSVAALAQVYKWVDKEGVVHYSDSPPEDAESTIVNVEPSKPGKADQAVSELLEHAESSAKRRAEEKQARSAAAQLEAKERLERKQSCKYARQQLISLQQNLPVYRDAKGAFRTVSQYDVYEGKREYLDDAVRDVETERVQRDIMMLCEHPDDRKEQIVAASERMMSKRCEAARVDLKSVERPEAKSPRQSIEEARQQVEKYCEKEK